MVVACVLLLPQIYIGFKGLKVAKNPDSSRGHIVWATILFVAAVLSLVSSIMEGVQNGFNQDVVLSAFSVIIDVLVYFDYIKAAKLVASGN